MTTQRASETPADLAEQHNNRGYALRSRGDHTEAIEHYREAIRLKPGLAEAHCNLGIALQEQGYLIEAIESYHRALHVRPSYVQALSNLGAALQARGSLPDAVAACREALRLDPDYVPAWVNLGTALLESGDADDAIDAFANALRVAPACAAAYGNLGVALEARGDLVEAIGSYREALRLQPDFGEACNHLMHLLQQTCDWAELPVLAQRVREAIQSPARAAIDPLTMLPLPTSLEEQLACARAWSASRLTPLERMHGGLGFSIARTPKPVLRIGYLSADFREHAVAGCIVKPLELHDRGRFEVFAYSAGPADGSAMRARLSAACDCFRDIGALSVVDAARRIHADRVDILVDLTGYTRGSRSQILALRPAPIQVSYLGYPGTMGAGCVDYMVTDRFLTPPAYQPYFTEQLVCLPDCYQTGDPDRAVAEMTPTRAACGLPDDGFVFCCFNNAYKITSDVFATWMRILGAAPGSSLWLSQANQLMAANLRREAVRWGITPDRLVFAPRVPPATYRALFRQADLFLDTFPYGAGATANDALWMGLPIVTCAGRTYVSRMAGSLLHACGLPELVTTSLDDYERLALRLARDRQELSALRVRLTSHRDTLPLFDAERFTRHLEDAYERMWASHLDQTPAP